MISALSRLGVAAGCLVSAACLSVRARPSVCDIDVAAAEREVREVSARYATVRDIEPEVAQYTDDVWFFSTLTPVPTVGIDARRQSIERRRAPVPGEFTRRETSGVMIGRCGDLAVEHGRFVTKWPVATGMDSVAGYYLLAYRKIAGEWKVAAASVHRRPLTGLAHVPGREERGMLVRPSEGTHLIFCSAPGLSVTLKVDSTSTGARRMAMGTAELAVGAENSGAHRDVDEVNYFLGGRGRAFIGADTVNIESGLTMYVPQGVRHGFVNTGSEPLRFAWTIVPQGLANSFRARGVPPGTACAR